MSFSIRFLDNNEYSLEQQQYYSRDRKICLGEIAIGNFKETFEVPTGFWSKGDYSSQWLNGLNRTVQGAEISCLITSIYDPASANFFTWWPLYREKDRVFVQNHIFFLKDAHGAFDLSDPYAFVRAHRTVSENGQQISEWTTSVDEIREFFESNR